MERVDIGFGVNGESFDAEFFAGADDAESDFASIGDENFFKHGRLAQPEESLSILDGLAIFCGDLGDDSAGLGLDFVHDLHCFDDADNGILGNFLPDSNIGWRIR